MYERKELRIRLTDKEFTLILPKGSVPLHINRKGESDTMYMVTDIPQGESILEMREFKIGPLPFGKRDEYLFIGQDDEVSLYEKLNLGDAIL